MRTNENVLRIWESLRSNHLEILGTWTPGELIYRETMYDYQADLANGLNVRQASRIGMAKAILTTKADTIELNEPLMVRAWPSLVVQVAAIRIARRALRRDFRVVTYAIENHPPNQTVGSFLGISAKSVPVMLLVRTVLRFITGPVDAVAFGSGAAEDNYSAFVRWHQRTEQLTVLELPAPCTCTSATGTALEDSNISNDKNGVLFVGEFSDRKGVRKLLDAWESTRRHDTSLTIIGKGPLEKEVVNRAKVRNDIVVKIDPTRSEIHQMLWDARVVVLLSRRERRWREQLGLPIAEGLSHGCSIVSTDATGYSSWLRHHNHEIVSEDASPNDVANAIETSILKSDSAKTLATLPTTDIRKEVDTWLHQTRLRAVTELADPLSEPPTRR
ncbi:glycosyltransferase [Gordonia sp. DT219]|uniref:glycosyltransferase n=1 Tax=Gordonia sp. DT219 TaxID=3416658 RepID=UPI003CE7150C